MTIFRLQASTSSEDINKKAYLEKLRQSPLNIEIIPASYVPLNSREVTDYLKKQQHRLSRKRPATDDTATSPKQLKIIVSEETKYGKKSNWKKAASVASSSRKVVNILELNIERKRRSKREKPKKKRPYEYRSWDISLQKEGKHHKSMMFKNRLGVQPLQQVGKDRCILCDGKPFYDKVKSVMDRHYRRIHYKRFYKIGNYYLLLCKCSDVQSRDQRYDRSGHHHCPECWMPLEKNADLYKHLISEHDYDELQIERKDMNSTF